MLARFVCMFVGLTFGMGLVQVPQDDEAPASPIEQAVIEYECTVKRAPPGAPESDYEACLRTRLAALRGDFGRDLSQVSVSDRRTIDSLCASIGAARGRDARVKCLSSELDALRLRRARGNPLPLGPEIPVSLEAGPAGDLATLAGAESSGSSVVWMGAGFVVTALGVASGWFVWTTKRRRAPRKCRSCSNLAEAGDLCSECRHKTAEALRRATAEHAEEERKAAEERRRGEELKEAQRLQAIRRAEDARLAEEARLRQQEKVRREREEEEIQRRQAEADRERSESAQPPQQAEFDPYAVLGVPRDASAEQIAAAYEDAKARFAPDRTSHLSEELQNYFRRKAQAVETAYQMLTDARTSSL